MKIITPCGEFSTNNIRVVKQGEETHVVWDNFPPPIVAYLIDKPWLPTRFRQGDFVKVIRPYYYDNELHDFVRSEDLLRFPGMVLREPVNEDRFVDVVVLHPGESSPQLQILRDDLMKLIPDRMPPHFKTGDRVLVAGNFQATVIETKNEGRRVALRDDNGATHETDAVYLKMIRARGR